ncbi:hypothetical protein HDU93_008040 [Gonapodya sp. JEL0774]|nr:hypothetical protein HDU93_008040 [Gonapodya sp. JEL0774]
MGHFTKGVTSSGGVVWCALLQDSVAEVFVEDIIDPNAEDFEVLSNRAVDTVMARSDVHRHLVSRPVQAAVTSVYSRLSKRRIIFDFENSLAALTKVVQYVRRLNVPEVELECLDNIHLMDSLPEHLTMASVTHLTLWDEISSWPVNITRVDKLSMLQMHAARFPSVEFIRGGRFLPPFEEPGSWTHKLVEEAIPLSHRRIVTSLIVDKSDQIDFEKRGEVLIELLSAPNVYPNLRELGLFWIGDPDTSLAQFRSPAITSTTKLALKRVRKLHLLLTTERLDADANKTKQVESLAAKLKETLSGLRFLVVRISSPWIHRKAVHNIPASGLPTFLASHQFLRGPTTILNLCFNAGRRTKIGHQH